MEVEAEAGSNFFSTAKDYSLALEFAQIDAAYQRRVRAKDSSEVASIVIEASKQYMLEIDQACQRHAQAEDLVNGFFVWSFAHIFYLHKTNSKNTDFAALVRLNYPLDEQTPLAVMLAVDRLPALVAHVQKWAQRTAQPETKRLLRRIASFVECFSTAYRASPTRSTALRLAFVEALAQKRQVLADLRDECAQAMAHHVNELSSDETRALGELMLLLGVLRGDLPALHAAYKDQFLLLCAAYALYTNPLCEEQHEASLLRLLHAEDNLGALENPFNRLVLRGLENCENAAAFVEGTRGLCAPWLTYHLGKLALQAGAARRPGESLHALTVRYLDYLIKLGAEFMTFWQYYSQVFDLEENVELNLLKQAVGVNLRQRDMGDFLAQHGKEAAVELVVAEVMRDRATRESLSQVELLQLLRHTEQPAVANRIFAELLAARPGTTEQLLALIEQHLATTARPLEDLCQFNYRMLARLYQLQLEARQGGHERLVDEICQLIETTGLKYHPLTLQAVALLEQVLQHRVELAEPVRQRLRSVVQFLKAHQRPARFPADSCEQITSIAKVLSVQPAKAR